MKVQLKETFTENGTTEDSAQIVGLYSICISGTWDGALVTIYRKHKTTLSDIDKLKEYSEGTISFDGECEFGFSESSDYMYYATVSSAGASTNLTIKISSDFVC